MMNAVDAANEIKELEVMILDCQFLKSYIKDDTEYKDGIYKLLDKICQQLKEDIKGIKEKLENGTVLND